MDLDAVTMESFLLHRCGDGDHQGGMPACLPSLLLPSFPASSFLPCFFLREVTRNGGREEDRHVS